VLCLRCAPGARIGQGWGGWGSDVHPVHASAKAQGGCASAVHLVHASANQVVRSGPRVAEACR